MSGVKGRSGRKPIRLPIQEMITMYLAGSSTAVIGREFKVSPRTVGRRLRVAGLDLVDIARKRGRGDE